MFLYVHQPTVYSNRLLAFSKELFCLYSLEFVKFIINNFHQAIFHQESLSHRQQKSSCNPILNSQLILNASFSMIDSHRNQELSQESSLAIGCLFTFEQCCSTWQLDMSPSYRKFTKKQVRQQANNTKAQHRNNEFQSIKSTVSINLLCENDSLKGLPAALGDIRFEVLLVILERLEGCRTLGVIDKLWEPPNPSLKLLSISLYCFCKDKQTLRRPRKPSSLLNKTSLFPFLFPFCLVWCPVWLKDESISSWTLLQSLSSSCTVVLDLM